MDSNVGRRVVYRVHSDMDNRVAEAPGTFLDFITTQDGVGRPIPAALVERENGTVVLCGVQAFRFVDSRNVTVYRVEVTQKELLGAMKSVREEVADFRGRFLGFSAEQADGETWTSATVVDDAGRVRTVAAYLVKFDQYEVPK